MIRFILVSLILHLLLLALMSYQKHDIIENPILSVEIVQQKESQMSGASVKTSQIKKNITSTRQQPDLPGDTSSHTNSSNAVNQSTEYYESKQVTKLPRVIKQIKAEYPETAKQARVEGAVKLSVLIDPNGTVTEVVVLEGPGYGLDETAQKALMGFQFSPAEKQNQKVSVKITYVYRFRLDSR